jgi:uncharacterized protein YdhG (YjbR/CyaY superfamily)
MKKATSKNGAGTNVPAKSVDEYLRTVPPESRAVLEKVRKTIRAAAPKAEELISYQMPAYKHHGMLVFFAAFKNHCSFFVASKALVRTLHEDLKRFDTSGVTIHFTADHPLPASLVKKIVKARVEENELRLRKKQADSKAKSCRKSRPCFASTIKPKSTGPRWLQIPCH